MRNLLSCLTRLLALAECMRRYELAALFIGVEQGSEYNSVNWIMTAHKGLVYKRR
jgi:hypothetical protein